MRRQKKKQIMNYPICEQFYFCPFRSSSKNRPTHIKNNETSKKKKKKKKLHEMPIRYSRLEAILLKRKRKIKQGT
jgi:hypothetical protein